MSQAKYPKAYEAYQQAVYRDGRNPTFWCSIGVLYYQINQYRDALDAYSRAIRLNPYISEVWYDLGTLVGSLLWSRRWMHLAMKLTITRSTNRATTKRTTPWTRIGAQQNSIRTTCTSRHDCSYYRAVKPRASIKTMRRFLKMSTRKPIKQQVSVRRPALNGGLQHPQHPRVALHRNHQRLLDASQTGLEV